MTALVKKIKNGRAYWYATDSARVNGQPRVVRQRYLGTVESIEAAFDAAFEPESIDVVEFGATAALWALAGRVSFGLWVDALVGPQGTGLSAGTYLQAAAVNRAVKPRSKRGFITYYGHSVLTRLVPAPPQAWASQRFWDAMNLVDVSLLERIEESYVKTAMDEFGIDAEALVYDGTNFHTFIASTNDKAPIAQRGHAKNKRFDLRLVGLALACSTDHRIPLAHIATAGNTPDSKVFAASLPKLVARLEAVGVDPASVTVVFDKGNNSGANLAAVNVAAIGFVGSLVPSQHRDLLAVPDEEYQAVEELEGVVAHRCERQIYGVTRSIVVTRSQSFLAKQLVGLAQTRGRVEVHLAELDRLLAGGRHKMDRAKLEARVAEALAAIQEVTLMYPPAKGQGRPRILRKLTRMDQTQQGLFELFGLDAFAPREGTTAKWRGF